jgi:regulatory protein
MKITKITSQVKRVDRYSIFVDDKYAFSLSADQLLEQKLAAGDEIGEADVKRLKKLSDDGKLYSLALRYVALRARSRWEIEDYLIRKKASSELVREIIKKLEGLDLINDTAFASSWVENRRLLSSKSHRQLVAELRAKHIADDTIKDVLEGDKDQELTALRMLIDKKRQQAKYKDDLKLAQYLSRQGFSYDDIKSQLKI